MLSLEKTIRGGTKGDSMELMEEWFRLVEEKNQLLRKENELMIEQRELQLQVKRYFPPTPLAASDSPEPDFEAWI